MPRIIKAIRRVSFIKTLRFNLKYFPLRIAVRLPVMIARQTLLSSLNGKVVLNGPIRTGMITIGFGDIGIFDRRRSRGIWQSDGTVVFEGKAHIGHGNKLHVKKDGVLTLGDGIILCAESAIICQNSVTIGCDSMLSWDMLIMDSDFHPIMDRAGTVVNAASPVAIGKNVWIGSRVTILKGVTIADGGIVGAGSVVTGNLDCPNAVYGGNPAKKIKEPYYWEH